MLQAVTYAQVQLTKGVAHISLQLFSMIKSIYNGLQHGKGPDYCWLALCPPLSSKGGKDGELHSKQYRVTVGSTVFAAVHLELSLIDWPSITNANLHVGQYGSWTNKLTYSAGGSCVTLQAGSN